MHSHMYTNERGPSLFFYPWSICCSTGCGSRAGFAFLGNEDFDLYTDASAVIGIVQREAIGRTRHIDVNMLWIQQRHYS